MVVTEKIGVRALRNCRKPLSSTTPSLLLLQHSIANSRYVGFALARLDQVFNEGDDPVF
jgi:hypothetical protein